MYKNGNTYKALPFRTWENKYICKILNKIHDFQYEIFDLVVKESKHQYLSINLIKAYNTCYKLVF